MNTTVKIAVSLFVVVILITSAFFVAPLLSVTSIGYSQGTQGFSFTFGNVYFNNAWWSSGKYGVSPWGSNPPTVAQFGLNSLNLQPSGMPSLSAATSAFVPDIYNATGQDHSFSWMLPTGTSTVNGQKVNSYSQYSMELVRCSFNLTLYLSGSGSEAGNYLGASPNWAGAQIWITLTPNEFLYFNSNPNQLYLAPALIQVASASWGIKSYDYYGGGAWTPSSGDIASTVNLQSVNPSQPGEVIGVYYSLGGTPVNIGTSGYTYDGQALDPAIFRSQYYAEITLNNFQAQNWFANPLSAIIGLYQHSWCYPAVQLNLVMYVWVVGVWQTYFTPGQVISMNNAAVTNTKIPTTNNSTNIEVILMLLAVAAIAIIVIGYAAKKKKFHP